jgi:hypothetical protein
MRNFVTSVAKYTQESGVVNSLHCGIDQQEAGHTPGMLPRAAPWKVLGCGCGDETAAGGAQRIGHKITKLNQKLLHCCATNTSLHLVRRSSALRHVD